MIIPIIEQSEHSSNPPEWAMLELNGELLPPAELGKGNDEMSLLEANQVELGSLHFTVDGKPVMTVGSHEMKGNVEVLKQPFAIMKKHKQDNNTEYEVVGVITKKFLFDQYPKSIMR